MASKLLLATVALSLMDVGVVEMGPEALAFGVVAVVGSYQPCLSRLDAYTMIAD